MYPAANGAGASPGWALAATNNPAEQARASVCVASQSGRGQNQMARFLNTSATNYFLEELIKAARERLIVISPFLKFNDRIRELLEDKDRMKIDVRIVYGKSELAPHEINWLRSLDYVRTSFCQNLHAKCYLNESAAIITSMNLYDFSQVNNNEMGVFIKRDEEAELYRETYEEAQRLIRVSEEVRLSAEKVEEKPKTGKRDDSKAKSSACRG